MGGVVVVVDVVAAAVVTAVLKSQTHPFIGSRVLGGIGYIYTKEKKKELYPQSHAHLQLEKKYITHSVKI